jgi:hypothetical protein
MLNGEVIYTKDTYSVKQYVIDAINEYNYDTKLIQLLSDMLYYGAAAQKYLNPNIADEDLVTNGVNNILANSEYAPESGHRKVTTKEGADTSLVRFTAAGARFDYVNKIYVKFTTENVENVTVTVNKNELEIISLGNNTYIAYSSGISALSFDSIISFELAYDGELIQTLEYTVNTYAWSMKDDAKDKDLALALYRYGVSAKDYDDSKNS